MATVAGLSYKAMHLIITNTYKKCIDLKEIPTTILFGISKILNVCKKLIDYCYSDKLLVYLFNVL